MKNDKKCEICDVFSGYVLQDSICVENKISNCLISFKKDECYQCETGYFLSGELRCISLKDNRYLESEQCNEYGRANHCLVCNLLGYRKSNRCLLIEKKVDDCTVNQTSSTCQICNRRLPSYNSTYCAPISDQTYENCMFFTHPLSCIKCKNGYEISRKYFLEQLSSVYQGFFYQLGFWKEKYYSIVYNTPVCQLQNPIPNCSKLGPNKNCEECNTGYTLSPNQENCFIKPSPPVNPYNRISNCYVFTDESYLICKICYEGYYLTDNGTKCQQHTKTNSQDLIENCEIFSQTENNQCIFCNNQYYLDEINGQCVKRTKFFNNCLIYQRLEDQCTQCESGHIFHYNNTFCSLEIQDCFEYNKSLKVLQCITCRDGFYLSDDKTSCINAGSSIEGCVQYVSSYECSKCEIGYYLNNGRCQIHDEFFQCKEMSITTKNVCTQCINPGSYTVIVSECVQLEDSDVVSNPNCKVFDSNKSCLECNTDYIIYSDGVTITCVELVGCLKGNKNSNNEYICETCQDSYLTYEGQCASITTSSCLYSFSKNSTYTEYNFVGVVPCQICNKEKYYSVDEINGLTYKCVSVLTNDPIDNCLNYGVSNYNYTCIECQRNYYNNKDIEKPICIEYDDSMIKSFDQQLNILLEDIDLDNFQWSEPSTKSQLDNYCYQVDENKSGCLICKNSYQPYYHHSSSLQDFLNENSNWKSYKYYNNIYDSTNKDQTEHYYTLKNPLVDKCTTYSDSQQNYRWSSNFEEKNYNTYSCKGGPLAKGTTETQPEYDAATLKIVYNVDKSALYSGGNYKTQYEINGLREPLCSSTIVNSISNCAKYADDLQLKLDFTERFKLSCYQCNTNYSLLYRNWDFIYQIERHANRTFIEQYYEWSQTDCILTSSISLLDVIDNCYYYEDFVYNQVLIRVCQACKPKYKRTVQVLDYKCLSTDPHYDPTRSDKCQSGYSCNKYLICQKQCPVTCISGYYCNNSNQCVSETCCAADGNCSYGDDGCQDSQYCYKSQCINRCQCESKGLYNYRCDSSTNYSCVPLLCDRAIVQTIDERAANQIEFEQQVLEELNSNNTYTRYLKFISTDSDFQIMYPSDNKDIQGNQYFDQSFSSVCQSYFSDYYNYTDYTNQGLDLVIKSFVDNYNKTVKYFEDGYNLTNFYTDMSDSETKYKWIYNHSSNDTSVIFYENEDYYTVVYEGNITDYQYVQGSTESDILKQELVEESGVVVTYYGDNSRQEVYLNGTTISFDPNQNQEIIIPLDTSIIKKEIQASNVDVHIIYYTDNWIKYVDISDPYQQTGYYTNIDYPEIQEIDFTPLQNNTIYVNGSSLLNEFSNNYYIFYPDSQDTTNYEKLLKEIISEVIDINLTDFDQMYKEQREIYQNDIYDYKQEKYFKENSLENWIATKTSRTDYIKYEFENDSYIWQNSTHNTYIFANETLLVQEKSSGYYSQYNPDGTRRIKNSIGITEYDIYNNKTVVELDGTTTITDVMGQETTFDNYIATKIDKIAKLVGYQGDDLTTILDDNSVMKFENNVYYFKLSNQNYVYYRLKSPATLPVFSIDNGDCQSFDNNYYITKDSVNDFQFDSINQIYYYDEGSGFMYDNYVDQFQSLQPIPIQFPQKGCFNPSYKLTPDEEPQAQNRRLFEEDDQQQLDSQDVTYNPIRLLDTQPFTDSDNGNQKTRTFLNGDVINWNDFNNIIERTVSFYNGTQFVYIQQATEQSKSWKNSNNDVLYLWDFYNLLFKPTGQNDISMVVSDYEESGQKTGTQYTYIYNSETINLIRFDNYTEVSQNVDKNIYTIYDISQNIISIDKSVKYSYQPTGEESLQPVNNLRILIDGTIQYQEDIITKTYTITDTSTGDYTEQYRNGEKKTYVNGLTSYFFNNYTVSEQQDGLDELKLKIYQKYFDGWEHDLEIIYNTTSGIYKTKYLNLTTVEDYRITDGTSQTIFFRNGTNIEYTQSQITLIDDQSNIYVYDLQWALKEYTEGGKTWTFDVEKNYFTLTEGNTSYIKFLDDMTLSFPSNTFPSQLTYPDGKIQQNTNYGENTVYYTGGSSQWQIINTVNSQQLTTDDLGTWILSDDILEITHNNQKKTYRFSDCARNSTISETTFYQDCSKLDMGNGDQGFFYSDESFIFKANGNIWYQNHETDKDLYYIINMNNIHGKQYRRGKIEVDNLTLGNKIDIETEERFLRFSNNTIIIDNLITTQRKIFENYQQSNQKYTTSFEGITTIINNLDTDQNFKYIKDNGDYIYKSNTELEVYFYNQFKINKNIDTGIITKTYDWHPFIIDEVIDGDLKTTSYKEQYQNMRNYKKTIYDLQQSKVISVVSKNDITYNVIQEPENFNEIYFPRNNTLYTKSEVISTFSLVTHKYQSDKFTEYYVLSNEQGSYEQVQLIYEYPGVRETLNYSDNTKTIENSNSYNVFFTLFQSDDNRVLSKTSAPTFSWTYIGRTLHNFDPYYLNWIISVDYGNQIITGYRETYYNQGTIPTEQGITVTNNDLTITGDLISTDIIDQDLTIILPSNVQIDFGTQTFSLTYSSTKSSQLKTFASLSIQSLNINTTNITTNSISGQISFENLYLESTDSSGLSYQTSQINISSFTSASLTSSASFASYNNSQLSISGTNVFIDTNEGITCSDCNFTSQQVTNMTANTTNGASFVNGNIQIQGSASLNHIGGTNILLGNGTITDNTQTQITTTDDIKLLSGSSLSMNSSIQISNDNLEITINDSQTYQGQYQLNGNLDGQNISSNIDLTLSNSYNYDLKMGGDQLIELSGYYQEIDYVELANATANNVSFQTSEDLVVSFNGLSQTNLVDIKIGNIITLNNGEINIQQGTLEFQNLTLDNFSYDNVGDIVTLDFQSIYLSDADFTFITSESISIQGSTFKFDNINSYTVNNADFQSGNASSTLYSNANLGFTYNSLQGGKINFSFQEFNQQSFTISFSQTNNGSVLDVTEANIVELTTSSQKTYSFISFTGLFTCNSTVVIQSPSNHDFSETYDPGSYTSLSIITIDQGQLSYDAPNSLDMGIIDTAIISPSYVNPIFGELNLSFNDPFSIKTLASSQTADLTVSSINLLSSPSPTLITFKNALVKNLQQNQVVGLQPQYIQVTEGDIQNTTSDTINLSSQSYPKDLSFTNINGTFSQFKIPSLVGNQNINYSSISFTSQTVTNNNNNFTINLQQDMNIGAKKDFILSSTITNNNLQISTNNIQFKKIMSNLTILDGSFENENGHNFTFNELNFQSVIIKTGSSSSDTVTIKTTSLDNFDVQIENCSYSITSVISGQFLNGGSFTISDGSYITNGATFSITQQGTLTLTGNQEIGTSGSSSILTGTSISLNNINYTTANQKLKGGTITILTGDNYIFNNTQMTIQDSTYISQDGITTIIVPVTGSWDKKVDYQNEYQMSVTVLQNDSEKISLKTLTYIFTLYSDNKEEIQNTLDDHYMRYYVNGTVSRVFNDQTMQTYYDNGTDYLSIDYNYIYQYEIGQLIFKDDLMNSLISKFDINNGSLQTDYRYDEAQIISQSQYQFPNGTQIQQIDNYDQITDIYAIRKYYLDNKYEVEFLTPPDNQIQKSYLIDDFVYQFVFLNNTFLDYKNDGSITIKDYLGNTLVQTLTQSVDFIQSIITSSNDIYETDLFTQTVKQTISGNINYSTFNGTTYTYDDQTNTYTYQLNQATQVETPTTSEITYINGNQIIKDYQNNLLTLIYQNSDQPYSLTVQNELVTLFINQTISYQFDFLNEQLQIDNDGDISISNGVQTSSQNLQNLKISDQIWIDKENDFIRILIENDFRAFNLTNGNYYFNKQKEFGVIEINLNDNINKAYLQEGQFIYQNKVYDPITENMIIYHSDYIHIEKFDFRQYVKGYITLNTVDQLLKFNFKNTSYNYQIDLKGQFIYTQGEHQYSHLFNGRVEDLDTTNLWIIQTDQITSMSYSTEFTYPITYTMEYNQYLKKETENKYIRKYFIPLNHLFYTQKLFLNNGIFKWSQSYQQEYSYYLDNEKSGVGFYSDITKIASYLTSNGIKVINKLTNEIYNKIGYKYILENNSDQYFEKQTAITQETDQTIYQYVDYQALILDSQQVILQQRDQSGTNIKSISQSQTSYQNSLLSYIKIIDSDTNMEITTFDNGVIIEYNQITKIYTYNYPSKWPFSQNDSLITSMTIDTINDPIQQIVINVLNGDTLSFTINNNVPQSINGVSWNLNASTYSMTLTENNIVKDLSIKFINNIFVLNYNSFDSSNTQEVKINFTLFSQLPYFISYSSNLQNNYTYQFLNQTSFTRNTIDSTNKTSTWYTDVNQFTLYGTDYTVVQSDIEQITTYKHSSDQKVWNFSTNKVTYTSSNQVKVTSLDQNNNIISEYFTYSDNSMPLDFTLEYTDDIVTSTRLTFQNNTIKTYVNDTDTTTWIYSNSSTFTQKPTELLDSQYDGEYDFLLQQTNEISYLVQPDGVMTYSTDTEIQKTYFQNDQKVVEFYDLNLILQKSQIYYLSGAQEGDFQESITSGNTTYTYTNGTIKTTNQYNSFYTIYPNSYQVLYPKYSYYFDSSDPVVPQDFQQDKEIYVYNNEDIKTILSDSSYQIKYTNSTIQTITLTDDVVTQRVFEYAAGTALYKSETVLYHSNSLLKHITKIDQNNYQFKEKYFDQPTSTLSDRKTIMNFPSENQIPLSIQQITYDWDTEIRTLDYSLQSGNNTTTKVWTNCDIEFNYPNSTIIQETIDIYRMAQIQWTNGTTVNFNLTQFIFTGCWYDNQYCVRQNCYYKIKCDCDKNEFCYWDQNSQSHQCQSQSECNECQNQGQWCARGSFESQYYYYCIDQPEDSLAPNDNCNGQCTDYEVCVNGTCDYKGTPCYFSSHSPYLGIFCAETQECINSVCYDRCFPECYDNYDCVFNETKLKFECQEKEKYTQLIITKACTLIQNCGTSEKLNECERCADNYSFLRTNKVVSQYTCVLTNISNCFIGKLSGTSYVCDDYSDETTSLKYISGQAGCYPGYLLDSGSCTKTPSSCMNIWEDGECRYCTNSYGTRQSPELLYSVLGPFKSGSCVDKPATYEGFITTSVAEEDKQRYFYCKYFKFYFEKAFSTSPVFDIGLGKVTCYQCLDGYYINDEKSCLPKSIPNCKDYDLTVTYANRANTFCITCETGSTAIYNSQNKIIQCQDNTPSASYLLIPGCSKYNIDKDCIQCKSDYALYQSPVANTMNQRNFCYLKTNYENCNQMDTQYFQTTGQIKCLQCNAIKYKTSYPKILSSNQDYVNSCIYIAVRDKCKNYNLSEINSSTLECIECISGYYLQRYTLGIYYQTVCLERTKLYSTCSQYYIDQDDCEIYGGSSNNNSSDSYTSASQAIEILLANPPPSQGNFIEETQIDWIMSCAVYSSATDCELCYAPKYRQTNALDNNLKCQNVYKEIPNCKYYNTDQECQECENFYILRNGFCYLKNVINCQNYLDEYTCESCPDEFPYLNKDGNCTKHHSNPWCYIYSQSKSEITWDSIVECEICLEDYYPDDTGICSLRQSSIPGCKYYEGQSLCKECQSGYYLSYDGGTCFKNPIFDTNCEQFTYQTQCSVCQFGYYLTDKGTCTKCETNENCAFCDPENPSKCYLCNFGYQMDTKGECSKNSDSDFKGLTEFNYVSDSSFKETQNLINEGVQIQVYILILLMLLI